MEKKYRIVFMGTPDFAVPSLKALARQHEVVAVVTQPDKPKGRGQRLTPSPVKQVASELKIPVYQPPKVKEAAFVEKLRNLCPEVICVVAFGQILSPDILSLPPLGCINVHASLLPRYRGAAPIEWCLINGETETGVTTMFMDAGLDTGDMLLRRKVEITPDMNAGELRSKLMALGAEVLLDTLNESAAGTLKRTKQPAESNYAPLLTKETGRIDWRKSALTVHNLVRALDPALGAYAYLNGDKYKIWRTRPLSDKGAAKTVSPGEIVAARQGIVVATGDGLLEILEWQAPGGKRLRVEDYLRGHKLNGNKFAA